MSGSYGASPFPPLPSANSTNNVNYADVIGNKADNVLHGPWQSSLYQLSGYMSYYHVHSPSICYPRDADPIILTAVNDALTWSEGAKVEIIPAATITIPFDIHWIILGNISANGNYVIKIYTGGVGAEVFWGEAAFTRDTSQVRGSQIPLQGPPVAANTRISASLLSGANNGETVAVKVYTHSYP